MDTIKVLVRKSGFTIIEILMGLLVLSGAAYIVSKVVNNNLMEITHTEKMADIRDNFATMELLLSEEGTCRGILFDAIPSKTVDKINFATLALPLRKPEQFGVASAKFMEDGNQINKHWQIQTVRFKSYQPTKTCTGSPQDPTELGKKLYFASIEIKAQSTGASKQSSMTKEIFLSIKEDATGKIETCGTAIMFCSATTANAACETNIDTDGNGVTETCTCPPVPNSTDPAPSIANAVPFVQVIDPAANPDLVAYWSMDNDAAQTAISSTSQTQTYVIRKRNGVDYQPGKFGNGYSFNENGNNHQFLTVHGLAPPGVAERYLPDSQEFSISTWLNYDPTGGSGMIFFDASGGSNHDIEYFISGNNLVTRADKYTHASSAPIGDKTFGLQTAFSLPQPIANEWHHLVWNVSRKGASVFVDGEFVSQTNESGKNIGFHYYPAIGAFWDGSPAGNGWYGGAATTIQHPSCPHLNQRCHPTKSFFKGRMDDFAYMKRELTECEIKKLAFGDTFDCTTLIPTPQCALAKESNLADILYVDSRTSGEVSIIDNIKRNGSISIDAFPGLSDGNASSYLKLKDGGNAGSFVFDMRSIPGPRIVNLDIELKKGCGSTSYFAVLDGKADASGQAHIYERSNIIRLLTNTNLNSSNARFRYTTDFGDIVAWSKKLNNTNSPWGQPSDKGNLQLSSYHDFLILWMFETNQNSSDDDDNNSCRAEMKIKELTITTN